jgi:polar amino acid transport system substrate-binding protein
VRLPKNPLITALALLLATPACNLPRDADHTLDRVRGGRLRVGLVVHPPWSTESAGRFQGVDVQLVRAAAADLQTNIAWVPGSESALLETLHSRELDLVIGGLSGASPWKKQVAFTRPYYLDSTVVSPLGPDAAGRLKGDSIFVEPGDPAAAYARKKGAIPVPVADLTGVRGLVAAPAWRLALLGRPPTGVLLHKERRVMAVAPGENAWLNWLERWLYSHQGSVPALLRAAAK